MLVTDAMPSVGSDQRQFMLQGRTITVRDGMCLDEAGTLAGSHLEMASAIRNTIELLSVELPLAVRMATEHPAEFLGLGDSLGRIAPGHRANLVRASDKLEVRASWIDGIVSESR
jgi:N-acetylglucosamine-6-phosphate deacetylase